MTSTTEDLQQLDETAFGARVERHRRELHVHCDADCLTDDEPGDDADGDWIGQCAGEAGESADRHAGCAEREDRDRDSRGDGPYLVLEVLGQSGACVGAAVGLAADHRDREAEQNTGDSGVHAGLVHEYPGHDGQWDENPPGADAHLYGDGEEGQRNEREAERDEVDVVGVEDRDDADGQKVVDDGQSQ